MNSPDSDGLVSGLVRDILTARVYEVASKTALQVAPKLSRLTGSQVYLKREDTQTVHSFKLRGAYNKIAHLTAKEQACGVIAASAGNHAQGVALAAKKLGLDALIVMPRTTPSIKIDAVKALGAKVELAGDSYSDAAEYCKQRTAETARTYIHPFDDPLVIAGQGTIGREILEQAPNVSHIFVPVGGGGLIAGIATYVKAVRPDVKIISVEPEDSNCLAASVKADKRVILPHVGIFADGVAVKQVGKHTFAIAQKHVDDFVTVTTDQICSAIKHVFEDTRSIVEPAGALAVAAIEQYNLPAHAMAVAICSGANVTFERLQQVAERTLLGSGKEALLCVSLPERPGTLNHLCQEVIGNRSISQFSYRFSADINASILIGIRVSNPDDRQKLSHELSAKGFGCQDLTDDDVAKEHVRHMIGGHGNKAGAEQFYQIDFPERPGALRDFLAALDNRWNISLFHYRSSASDTGNVLVGFQADKTRELEHALTKTAYSYRRITATNSIKTFIAGV